MVTRVKSSLYFLTFILLFTFCSESTNATGPDLQPDPEDPPNDTPMERVNDPIYAAEGNDILLDGTISSEEWASAASVTFVGTTPLKLMHSNGFLMLGIPTGPSPVVTIFLQKDNDVYLCHSSAALGTAIFRKNGNTYERVQSFAWYCRDTSMNESAQNARANFLQANGWVGTNGSMGNSNQVEYKFAMPDDSLNIAIVSLGGPEYIDLQYWPSNLTDDCTNKTFTTGPIPESGLFLTHEWITIKAQ